MSPVERLQAAIEKLEKMQSTSTVGAWVAMESRRGIAGFDGLLDAVVDEGHVLPWDALLIVTLHRTIDAQLAILRTVVEVSEYVGLGAEGERITMIQNALDLADAILGGTR